MNPVEIPTDQESGMNPKTVYLGIGFSVLIWIALAAYVVHKIMGRG